MLAYYALFFLFILYRVLKVIYNLYLHPLAKFPGPKFAAATHFYEFYWSIIRDGEFIWEIERLHKKYGTLAIQSFVLALSNNRRSYCPYNPSRASYQRPLILQRNIRWQPEKSGGGLQIHAVYWCIEIYVFRHRS
jgi:hypothetical protein